MRRSYTRTVRFTGTGNVQVTVAPEWLKAPIAGKYINSRILLEATSTPATATADLYIEDRITEGRESTDPTYSSSDTPTVILVDSVTGLTLAKSVAQTGTYPVVPVGFRGGVAVKLVMSNTGGGAWAVTVSLTVEFD